MKIDICIQATLRPGILERTLESFNKNLFGRWNQDHDYRCICNIDCIGDENRSPDDVVTVLQKFFGNKTICIINGVPCFSHAVIETWKRVESEFFFNLEDDWILNKKIDIEKMIKIMQSNPIMASLRLPKGPWKKHAFSQNPSLIRTSWMKIIIDKIRFHESVEVQLYNIKYIKDDWLFGLYPAFAGSPIITDIGREWRDTHNFKKGRVNFATWTKRIKK